MSSALALLAPHEVFYQRAEALETPQVISTQELPETYSRTESLEEMSDRIAQAWNIPTTTLSNLWHSESAGSTTISNTGGDRGLVQINKYAHPEVTDAEAYDPEYALSYAAHAIASSTQDAWVVCNCYSFLKTKIKGLPRMSDIVPNSTPHAGAVAIFYYSDKKTGARLKHVAYVESIDSEGFEVAEANFGPCDLDKRYIAWNDPHLEGFWSK